MHGDYTNMVISSAKKLPYLKFDMSGRFDMGQAYPKPAWVL